MLLPITLTFAAACALLNLWLAIRCARFRISDKIMHGDAGHALLAKRYDLQAALYLLAMHRLLKARLPDYDPHQHLGGSMTVFLRGSRSPGRGVVGEPAPVELIEALDSLFAGEPHAIQQEATA